MLEFGTTEWLEALMNELNASAVYARAASNWEGDFYFIVTPEGDLREPMYLYMDLWHGKCRGARVVDDPSEETPVFRMKATPRIWKKVVTKQLDPIQGLMTRQIRLQGNMMKIMSSVKAAQELVECVTRVPTIFPEWMP
ncbi:MAG: SCP2 sterol-binding domain-containing protein [Anaerolineae bacterium]